MKNKTLLSAFIFFIGFLTICYFTSAKSAYTINLDIGRNIAETAERSGASYFAKESHWGLHFYEIVNMPADISVQFSRQGYEIIAKPLFSILMSADSENKNNMAVENIQLQYSYHAKSHEDAEAFVEGITNQFRQGKWKRHIRDTSPAVSGRSAYLNASGKIQAMNPIDPDYHMSLNDWIQVTKMGHCYEWLGDGVLARLHVDHSVDSRGLTYNIDLEFQDFAIDNRRMDAREAKELADGDKKGWKSTERHKKEMEENREEVRVLEANAVRRGDHLVVRD